MTAAACSRSPAPPSVSIDRVSAEPAKRLRGQPIGGGAAVARRQRRRGDVDDRLERGSEPAATGADAVHLDHLHALQRHVGREQIADRPHVGVGEIDRATARARCASAWSLTSSCRSW